VQLDRSALLAGRVVVAFTFPDERPGNRRYWLLVEHGDAEVCYSDPGGEPDLMVEARSLAFVDWHRGERSWQDVLRSGDVKLIGPTWLRRSFPPGTVCRSPQCDSRITSTGHRVRQSPGSLVLASPVSRWHGLFR
jgi:hypothetical protein